MKKLVAEEGKHVPSWLLYASQIIEDGKTQDAVSAYACILMATKEILGIMGESDRKAAIEAASYTAWRSIMGGKEPPKDE